MAKEIDVNGNILRCVYVAEFSDGYAYVGTTNDYEARVQQHLFDDKNSQVFQHKRHTGLVPEFRKLTDYMSAQTADLVELKHCVYLASIGKKMLNEQRPGGFCGLKNKQSKHGVTEKIATTTEYADLGYESNTENTQQTPNANTIDETYMYIPTEFLHIGFDMNLNHLRFFADLLTTLYVSNRHSDCILNKEDIKQNIKHIIVNIHGHSRNKTFYTDFERSISDLENLSIMNLENEEIYKVFDKVYFDKKITDNGYSWRSGQINTYIYTNTFSLFNERKKYVRCKKDVLQNCHSIYTARIYIMLCLDIYTQQQITSIQKDIGTLRKIFKLERKYTQKKDFVKRIIKPAYAELQDMFNKGLSEFYFSYTYKKCNPISSCVFEFLIHSKENLI